MRSNNMEMKSETKESKMHQANSAKNQIQLGGGGETSGRVVYSSVLAAHMVVGSSPNPNLHQCLQTHLEVCGQQVSHQR